MTTENLGENGFKWFIGVVDDRDDPLKQGRVRVRAYNIHGNKVQTPTSAIPWATVLMSCESSSLKQVGRSATGLQVGSTVFGFFMDGNETMMPVIFGVMPGKDDLSKLAAGQMSLNKPLVGPEPKSAFNAKYPYNKVFQSESGHVVEIDDTPNFERMHTYHKSGTYSEVNHNGQRVSKIVGDDFEVVVKNKTVFINGNMTVEVKGNYNLNVTGDITVNGKTINMNRGTKGAARIGDVVPDSEVDGSQGIGEGSTTVFIG